MDVTDPRAPAVVNFVPGPANTATLQVDLHGTTLVTALEQHIPGFGGDPTAPYDEGVVLWSLEQDPVRPRRLGQFRTGGRGTHRNCYPGGQYVHLAANMAGFSGNIYVVLDISDPAHPVEAGRWWVPGQHLAGGETPAKPGISLHGPAVPDGDLVYLPYGSAGVVVLDISDVSAPRLVGELPFSPPFRLEFGVHGVVLDRQRSVAYLNSEGVVEPPGTVPRTWRASTTSPRSTSPTRPGCSCCRSSRRPARRRAPRTSKSGSAPAGAARTTRASCTTTPTSPRRAPWST